MKPKGLNFAKMTGRVEKLSENPGIGDYNVMPIKFKPMPSEFLNFPSAFGSG